MSYAPENNKLLEWGAVQQLFFTAPVLPLVSATVEHENAHSLQIKRPKRSPAEKAELDDEKDVVRGERYFLKSSSP